MAARDDWHVQKLEEELRALRNKVDDLERQLDTTRQAIGVIRAKVEKNDKPIIG